MLRMRDVLLATVAVLACPFANAQVTARQGTPPPAQETHFASPMILELPFPNVMGLGTDASFPLPAVHKYICDKHVSLRALTVEKRYKGRRKARKLELVISGYAFVAESYDRRVDIALGLSSGGVQIGGQTLRNLKAEEARTTPFTIVVPVDEQRLHAAYESAEQPQIHLTVTVRDDS
jgi:hypothetical protein